VSISEAKIDDMGIKNRIKPVKRGSFFMLKCGVNIFDVSVVKRD
jgi:hypothetical protein